MAFPSLDSLITPLTRAEVEAQIYAAMVAQGVPITTWRASGVARTIVTATAIVGSAFSALQAQIAKAGFLSYAEGGFLAQKATEDYNTPPIPGTFASGNLRLDNTGGGVFSVGVGQSVARNSVTGKTYRNTVAFTLAALETNKIVPYSAVELGSASSSAAGAIDAFETPLVGVTVTNPAAFVGQDDEGPESLRTRARAALSPLSPNGAREAPDYIAKSAVTSLGTSAGVTRTGVVPSLTGNTSIYLATASGPVTGVIGDLTTALGAVNDAIQKQAVPQGILATVLPATMLSIPLTYSLWVKSTASRSADQIKSEIAAAYGVFCGAQQIGGIQKVAGQRRVFTDAIGAVISEVAGDDLVDFDLIAPASDVVVLPSDAPVAGTISATVTMVAV